MFRFGLVFFFTALAGASGSVVIDGKATVLVGRNEPAALRRAADDLVADFGKVLGSPLRVVNRAQDAGPVTICVSLRENGVESVRRTAGTEVLQIRAAANPWKGSKVRQVVVLTGSDMRGAIYAVYEFSRRYLGVDPLYYWTDLQPERQRTVTLADDLAVQEGPASFRYRGWFINDEDLLTGWKPGTADHTGIALEVWDKVFEAVLRLKGNMIVPGTFIFPDEPQVKAAGERGLIITQHHIEVLGTNTYRWPDDQPYSFSAHPELLIGAWTAAMNEYGRDQEVIWTLGYRGRHDRAFWVDDASAGKTDAERAATIQRAIAKQMEIVNARRKNSFFLMNAWMEAVPFVQSGLLKIPPGVAQVWPDDGYGVIRDEGKIGAGAGVYYHTAMHNAMANQLTENVPLERIERELGRAARAHATEYMLVNTSDIRPVVMTTRAVMELAWNARAWTEGGQAAKFRSEWCGQFGAQAAPVLEEYYRSYFAAFGRNGAGENRTLGDNAYHTVSREILVALIKGESRSPRPTAGSKTLENYGALYARATKDAAPRWDAVRELAMKAGKLVTPASRDLWVSHVKTQAEIQRNSNAMLLEIALAVAEKSPAERLARVERALADAEAVQAALQGAEFGKWQGFYRGDLFVNVRHTIELAKAYRDVLQGKGVPAGVSVTVRPEDPYVAMKAYQGARRVALGR